MLVSRTLTLGLVVFAVALLASTIVEKARMRDEPCVVEVAEPALGVEPVTVVDLARGVDASLGLVRLRGDERVTAVDDQPISDDGAADELLAERARGPGKYIDLTVTGARGSRRVLVLMH